MSKLLSIIVPAYNMELFLGRCLDSFLVSNSFRDVLEVLIINDGSTDSSSIIAHEYESRYEGLFRVLDKVNGHYGSCVNCGLSTISGKYVKIVDADDWVDTTALEHVLDSLRKLDVDMVLTQYSTYDAKTKSSTISYAPNITPYQALSFRDMTYDSIGVYVIHSIIYRTDFLTSIEYHQTQGIPYTDTEWVYKPICYVKDFVYLPEPVTYYFVGRNGQSMDDAVLRRSMHFYADIAKQLISANDSLPTSLKDSFGFATTERQIRFLVESYYKNSLIQYSDYYDSFALRSFDEYLKTVRLTHYEALDKLVIKPSFPIHYVRFWRRFHFRFPVDVMRYCYEFIKYGNR